ncbi:MAG TPA: phosphoglucosamine mutase [Acidimicrobiales bacterium]|nr:phosphoglucosamine mutase [Acidimicrobiales bacterium]
MTPRFGTDGVRGVANTELTPEFALALGRAAARVLGGPRLLIGRDTRVSGPLLQAALTAGVAAEGIDAVDLGVLPTPAVAALAAAGGVPAAMISASHNGFADNGIKLFARGGHKLADDVEARLVAELEKGAGMAPGAVAGAGVGVVRPDRDGRERYQQMVLASLAGRNLGGLRVALDCANGAAAETGPELLRRAGAEVVAVLGDHPDGVNINDGCGSTYPGGLQAAVVELGADAGLALDGDADRVIAVDDTGAVVDGDQTIAALALDRMARGVLTGNTVVVTVMTNLGFHLAMAERGISVHTTAVGDRNVLEALARRGWSLGGEQSGHVIFPDLATTGDGVLTGLQLLDAVVRQGRPLSELAGEAMVRLPQVLRNVPVTRPAGLAGASAVWNEVRAVEAGFGDRGRVLLRSSGTEPLIRVMVEAPTHDEAEAAAARLADLVAEAIG